MSLSKIAVLVFAATILQPFYYIQCMNEKTKQKQKQKKRKKKKTSIVHV